MLFAGSPGDNRIYNDHGPAPFYPSLHGWFWHHQAYSGLGAGIVMESIYLNAAANLVPKWLPPSQMFWAVTTTVLFALAAVALLANRIALLATRLLTMMLVIFGLVVWVPLLLLDPHNHTNWNETTETFAIAGAAWILADLLGEYRLVDHRPR
jgi:hypothetical protein